ncbi:MAG: DUF3237 domain-containing protein [Caldimonas sp.]
MSDFTLPPPRLEHLCDLAVEVGAPLDAGHSPLGQRRLIAILGGSVGGRLCGRVLPGGADFQLIHGATLARLEARYMLELDDGARVFVQNNALRVASAEVTARLLCGEPVDPQAVYFRGQVSLETGDARWSWLNERQFLCVGQRFPAQVRMSFYVVL